MPMVSIQPGGNSSQPEPCVGLLHISRYKQPTTKILTNYLESQTKKQSIWELNQRPGHGEAHDILPIAPSRAPPSDP